MSPSGSPLPDAQTGQRWVIRHRLPDGSATDLIGWLQLVVADFVHLATADGAVHIVERASVVAARRAPAAPGGPPPDRVSSAEVEHRALSGWLALHEPLGEWTLRAAGGFTGRANSCQAVGDPGMAIAAAADRIVEYSAEHAIAPLAQVVAGSAEEQALRDLGWTDTYVPTEVLAIRLADFLGEVMPDPGVRVSNTLSPQWWQAYQLSRPNDADPAMLKMILDGQPPRAFAGGRDRSRDGGHRPRPPEPGLARPGIGLDRPRPPPAGLGHQDHDRLGPLGGTARSPLRLPAGRHRQRGRHHRVRASRLRPAPPLLVPGAGPGLRISGCR